MRKLLSLLTVVTIVGTTSSNVVSCGERTVQSLDDRGNDIQSASGGDKYHDITYWASDVITVNDYKSLFLTNLGNAFAQGGALDYRKFIEFENYNEQDDQNLVAAPFQLLANYQKGSNTGDATGKLSDAKTLQSWFKISLYNASDQLIAVSNEDPATGLAQWKDDTTHTLTAEKNPSTGVYVISFSIGITPTKVGVANHFVGQRTNIVQKQTNIGVFYAENPDASATGPSNALVINSKDTKFNQGKITTNSQWYMNKTFDYRYKVTFYFTVS